MTINKLLQIISHNFSNVARPFGMVRHNFVDVMQGNIFDLANKEDNSEEDMSISHERFLTSRFSRVYKVSTF